MFKKLFCKHEYEEISKSSAVWYNFCKGYWKELYTHYKCKKCGKLKIETKTVYPNIPFNK